MKGRFLGRSDMVLPNGKTVTITQTTTALDVGEFADYMTKVEAWAADRGVWLEDSPDE